MESDRLGKHLEEADQALRAFESSTNQFARMVKVKASGAYVSRVYNVSEGTPEEQDQITRFKLLIKALQAQQNLIVVLEDEVRQLQSRG